MFDIKTSTPLITLLFGLVESYTGKSPAYM